MRFILCVLCVFTSLTAMGWPQQVLVFPAVADEVPGEGDSLWVTSVRVVKKNPYDSVTVRRKWVCLPGGGFADDPAQARTWDLSGSGPAHRAFFASGGDLLQGTGANLGAVALEVEGGEVIAFSYVADVSLGIYSDAGPVVFGLGQSIFPEQEAQMGPAYIPWLPGCFTVNCYYDHVPEFMRNNIGLINPNSEPLTITGEVLAFDHRPLELNYHLEAFSRQLLPFEWVQFPWRSTQYDFGSDQFGVRYYPSGGFILNLMPDEDVPYFAYASTVFSPLPNSGFSDFSDPMFIPAVKGSISPFVE